MDGSMPEAGNNVQHIARAWGGHPHRYLLYYRCLFEIRPDAAWKDLFMKQMVQDLKLPLLLVCVMSLGAALALPITPIDETRYVSAAWEMWNTHSYLVPFLNGEPYSH